MIERLMSKIAKCLDEEKIPFMIIGGQAVLLYGTPRLTRDIDITLGVDTDRFSSLERVCRKLKLKILPENSEDFAKDTMVLPVEEIESRIRVDFMFSFSVYEQQAIRRVKKVKMNGQPVKFASCEDIIIHKMLAGRAIDNEDVINILLKNKDSLDIEYIRKWLLEFSEIPEHKEILGKFNNLL